MRCPECGGLLAPMGEKNYQCEACGDVWHKADKPKESDKQDFDKLKVRMG